MPNEKRKNIRIEYGCTIHCSKVICGSNATAFDPPVDMSVKNISPEGFCISSPELFEERSVLRFDILLEDIPYQGITGTIIWRTKKDGRYYYGLHLRNISGRLAVHIAEIGRKVSGQI